MKYIYNLCLLLCAFVANAQIETTTPLLFKTQQGLMYNPGVMPEYKVSLGLPGLSGLNLNMQINNMQASYITKSIGADNYLSIPDLISHVKQDYIGVSNAFSVDLFHLQFKGKKWFGGVNANTRTFVNVQVAKDLVGFLASGNGAYVGKTASFSDTRIDVNVYNEFGFNLGRKFDKLTIGGRVKYLHGIACIQTDNLTLEVTTPNKANEEITAKMSGNLLIGGLPKIGDESDINPNDYLSFNNTGFGFDFGLQYELTERLKLMGSVTDMGYIKWKDNAYNYKQSAVSVGFAGFDKHAFEHDSVAKNFMDSVIGLFDGKAHQESFTTSLPTRFMLAADFKLSKRNFVTGAIHGQYYLNKMHTAYTIAYSFRTKMFDFNTNYTINGNKFANVGLGIVTKLGPLQLYIVQDNVLGYFMPEHLQLFHLRMGINMVFGKKD